jgi:hypothetical protein
MMYQNIMVHLRTLLHADADSTEAHANQFKLNSSKEYYETVMRLYYVRHGFGMADSYMTHTLVVLAFMIQARLATLKSAPNSDDTVKELDDICSTTKAKTTTCRIHYSI